MLSNVVVSIQAMSLIGKTELTNNVYDDTSRITGISYILSGLSGMVGLLPLASSASVVKLSGILSRLPFVLASILMLCLGFFKGLSNIVGSIPDPIIYTVLLIIFIQLVEIGFEFFKLIELNSNQLFIISFSLLMGMGVMFLPDNFIQLLHPIIGNIVGNGLVVAMFSAIIFEQSFTFLSKKVLPLKSMNRREL